MTIDDIKKYFVSSYRFSKETGMSHTTWINWMIKGFVPLESQNKLEKITNGVLKANLKHGRDCD